MEYLNLIISFVVGGGITSLINWRIKTKTEKVDFADKAIAFEEKFSDKLMQRIEDLEQRLAKIEKMSCKLTDCEKRIQVA